MKKEYRNLLLALLLLSFLIYFYCYLPNSKIVEGVANSCWGDTSTLRDSIATFTDDLDKENIITSMCNIYNRGERAADPDDEMMFTLKSKSKTDKREASMMINEDGGRFDGYNKMGENVAGIGVGNDGGGLVDLRDKFRYRK